METALAKAQSRKAYSDSYSYRKSSKNKRKIYTAPVAVLRLTHKEKVYNHSRSFRAYSNGNSSRKGAKLTRIATLIGKVLKIDVKYILPQSQF